MTMLSNETVRKLHEMRLGVMAEAFSAQLEDAQFQAVSFEDRFAMLVCYRRRVGGTVQE